MENQREVCNSKLMETVEDMLIVLIRTSEAETEEDGSTGKSGANGGTGTLGGSRTHS